MSVRFPLPDQLPLFPLSGVIMPPRAHLPLHIFEPRYLQMVEAALRTPHRLIGIIQPDATAKAGLTTIGSAGRIIAFSEHSNGRLLITLQAVSRFRLSHLIETSAPFLYGQVDWSEYQADSHEAEDDPGFDRDYLLTILAKYMTMLELSTDWDMLTDVSTEKLINALAMLLPFEPAEKQALLEAPRLADRRILLTGLIEFALYGGNEKENLQ